MFTGIIEAQGQIQAIREEQSNVHFTIASDISRELRIDQSVCHDGVCLTVVALGDQTHTVTAIRETLDRTSLKSWQTGRPVNLERCLAANGRFDGHIVQGHVDGTARCLAVTDQQGSWLYRFELPLENRALIVEKGSVCINGVSLTVVEATESYFSVAIIPYTHEHTTFSVLEPGHEVNLEFDIIGKYVARLLSLS